MMNYSQLFKITKKLFHSGSNASLMGGAKQLMHIEVGGDNLGPGVIR